MRLRQFLDILGADNRIALMNPVYPVYVDNNVMAGHTGAAEESGIYGGLLYFPALRKMASCPKSR